MVGTANKSVFGIFSRLDAERAINVLRGEGFREADISCLFAENKGTKDFAIKKQSKAPEGAAVGTVTGAAVGGAIGLLTGIGTLAFPVLGPVVIAGPLLAALMGMAVGGSIGGLTGVLIGMGIPEYEAKRYEGQIKEGKALLSVHCDDHEWVKKAEDILKREGGVDIASSKEAKSTVPGTATDKPLSRSSVEGQRRAL